MACQQYQSKSPIIPIHHHSQAVGSPKNPKRLGLLRGPQTSVPLGTSKQKCHQRPSPWAELHEASRGPLIESQSQALVGRTRPGSGS